MDEVVANGCEMMLQDSQAIRELCEANRTLGERIGDFLRDFVQSLREAFGGQAAHSPEAQILMQYAEELQRLWDEGFKAAVENRRAGKKNTAYEKDGVRHQAVDSRGNVVVDAEVAPELVKKTLQDIFDGKHRRQGFTFPVLKHTPQVYIDYCHLDGDRSFVMKSKKAYKAMQSNVSSQHALGVDGMMKVIRQLYTPEYIVLQNEGNNAGHYVAVLSIDGGDTLAVVDLGDYRSGNDAVNGESGFYNLLITAFATDEEYLENSIFTEGNDIIYDRSVDKKYEAPEHVALGDSPVGHASETSSDFSITDAEHESKSQNQVADSPRNDRAILAAALESAAYNDTEREILRDYQDRIAKVDAIEADYRAAVQAYDEARAVDCWSDRTRELKEKADKLSDKLSKADRELMKLNAMRPLQEMMLREKKAERRRSGRAPARARSCGALPTA